MRNSSGRQAEAITASTLSSSWPNSRSRPLRTWVALTDTRTPRNARSRAKSTSSARMSRSGLTASGSNCAGASARPQPSNSTFHGAAAAHGGAATAGIAHGSSGSSDALSGPRPLALLTRIQKLRSASRAPRRPSRARPSASTTAFIAPALAPLTAPKPTRSSSSRRSSTPQV